MTIINCIVVDDNDVDRLAIEDYIQQSEGLQLLGSFSNPIESLEVLKMKLVHLLFLDIDMPVINGVDFFKTLANPPLCVFNTAFADYAVDAFNVQAIDYLLKPVKKERFDKAISRVRDTLDIKEKALHYDTEFEENSITIKEGGSINKVLVCDIIYLEALTNWTKIITADKKYITLCNLKNFLEELPESKFVRVHRSYAVAKNKITRIQRWDVIVADHKVPLGKTYRQNVNQIFTENVS